MSDPVRILLVEDANADAELAEREIRKLFKDCVFQRVDTREEFVNALETLQPDVVLSDYNLPAFDGMKALQLTVQFAPFTPFIIWTGSISEDTAVECMKAGANNYIIKENLQRLGPAVKHALAERQLMVDRSQAEIRYRAIFEQSHDAIFILDFNGHLIVTNQRAADLLGYTLDELPGLSVKDISAEPEKSDMVVKRLMNGENVLPYERLFRKKDGTQVPVEINVELVHDMLGKPLHIQSIVRDITERKQAEENILAQERRFRALIENSLDNISLLASDGTLLWENPAVNRTLGYRQDEHVGRNIFTLMHPDDAGWTQARFSELMKKPGGHESGVFRLLHQNGTWRWIEAIATNLLDEPGVRAIVINYRDITERKQAEIEIRQRTDDLALFNAINEAVIRGEALNAIVSLLANGMKRIFSSTGSTVYMFDHVRQSLTMQQYDMLPDVIKKLESLIGGAIPLLRIPVRENGFFYNLLSSNRGVIISDPHEIQRWMGEFVESEFLPSATQGVIRKLIPQIYKALNIRSVIIVPLISNGITIGLMDVSSQNLFTENELERIEKLGGQLTAAIQRHQANEGIKRSEEFLHSVQNALSAHICILDEKGVIVQVNEVWRKFGDQNGLVHDRYGVGLNYLEICDSAVGPYADEASVVAQSIRDVMSGRRSNARIEYPCDAPNEKRWFILQVTKFEEADRLWVVLAHENITERITAEHALKESQSRYRSLFEDSPISLWEEDFSRVKSYFDELRASGINDFRSYFDEHPETIMECARLVDVLDVNRVTLDLMQVDDKTQVLGRLNLSLSDETAASFKAELIALAEGKDTYMGEGGFYTSNGEKRDILFSLTVAPGYLDTLGKVFVSIIDITDRKKAEIAEREQRAIAEALRDTAEKLNSTLDYGEVLDHILNSVEHVVPHDCATIMLIEGRTAYVARSHGYEKRGFDAEVMNVELSLSETTNLRQMLKTKQPVVVSNMQTYKGWKRLHSTDWLRSNVGAPILSFGEVIGFILLDSETPGYFTTTHAERLKAFANQAAIAIHNARLLQQAKNEIAVRKQTEEELRTRDELLRDAQKLARLGHYALDFTTGLWTSSDILNQIFGIDENYTTDIDGWVNLVHPSQQDEMREYFLQYVISGNNPFDREYRIVRQNDQQERWVHGLGRLELDDKDVPVRMIGTIQDITERRQAEYELRHSHSLLNATLEATKDGILVVGMDRKISSFNRKFLELWRIPYSATRKSDDRELLKFVMDQLKDPSDFLDRVEQLYKMPEADSFDELEFKDGRVFERHSQPQKLQDEIVGRVWSFRDITERKKAERELRESEQRFQQLADNIREAFWITNAITGEEEYASPAVETIWGRPLDPQKQAMSPNAFMESIFPDDLEMVTNTLEEQRRGKATEMEYRITRPDGSIRWIWDRAFPIFDDTGGVIRLAGIAADVTERKQIEREVKRHLDELEALYENGLAVGRLLEPHEIGERIINTFNRYLSWHHVTIRLIKEGSDELELVAYSLPHMEEVEKDRVEKNFANRISKVGQGLSGWAAQNGKPIRTGNVHEHPQYIAVYEDIRSGLYMPLMIGKIVVGVISVESEAVDAFSPQDERLLATLANQAAIAFENARLYQSIQQELAERKRMEKALRSSEAHYRELADSITDVFFEMDQDMRYTYWNKASEMLTGVAEKDALGKTMREIFGESDEQSRIENIYKSVFETHHPRSFETNFIMRHEKRFFEATVNPSTRGVSVVAKDVSERRQLELLQQKRFELMEFSAHNPLDELMRKIMDEISGLTGSEIGFFHFMEEDQNTIGMQVWSTKVPGLFDIPFEDEMHHHSVDQAGVWADAVRQRRSVIHNDFESLPQRKGVPDGHVRLVREMVIPIIRNERIVAIMGVANKAEEYTHHDLENALRMADYAWDITERKRMQADLAEERNQLAQRVEERTAELIKSNSNLARALRVKDEFLANMSHELRTPLNAILGLSESLAEQIAGPLNEKQLKYITTIGESGHHLLSLINDILDLAKIEAGQITLDLNKVDIYGVCQASLRMVKQLAQKKNQDILLNIDANIGLIWADERRLKQMIVNLLSNAVKFTPDYGKLELEVRGHKDENFVEISVVDNGIGISENDLARLFQPFVQLDSGLARESTGTGLGLALVSQMARLHGGSVAVFSKPGQGSRFTIKLPWEPALTRDTVERLRNTGRLGLSKNDPQNKKKILLIEDTTDVVMMIRDYLEPAGYHVVTAQDGVEGIEQAQQIHPDLILMDIQMPRMDGIEATKKLRADPKFGHVPIIALTALAMPNDRERCIEAGMNEYISKPVNLRSLVKIIRKCLSDEEEKTRPL